MIDIFFHDKTGVVSGFPGQIDGFEYADGNGEIHYYRLFDGVGIMLLRLEMEAYTEIRTQIGRLEVNFCVNGRFETSFSMRDRVLLKPGDMAVSCYDGFHGSSSESCFPLGYYEGICLEIEPAAAGNWIKQNAPAFSVDFAAWKQNLLGCKWYMVGAAGPRCEHVFRELYESAFYEDTGFLQLKTLELLMLLGRIPQENTAGLYCSSEQTVLAHHLRDHLLTNREGYISLASLAAEHEISVSHLQKLFKQVYGVPIYRYIKEYRLEQAAVELVRSGKSVTEIAQQAGYDNTQVDRGNQEKAGVKHSLDIVKQQAPAPDAQGEQPVDDQTDHKVAEKQNDKGNAPVRVPMLNQPNNRHIRQLAGNVLHRVGTGCIKQGVQRAAVKAEPYQTKQQRRIQQQSCPKRQECQGVRQCEKDPYTRRQPRNEAAAALPPRDKQAGA